MDGETGYIWSLPTKHAPDCDRKLKPRWSGLRCDCGAAMECL